MSTSFDGVLEFLAAVHAADEQAALRAIAEQRSALYACGFSDDADRWDDATDGPHVLVFAGDGGVAVAEPLSGAAGTAAHIARHDPQSVLARVQAERALVALHRPETRARGIMCAICAEDIEHGSDREGDWPCDTLRVLAWGYRGREGWRAEWTPDEVEMRA